VAQVSGPVRRRVASGPPRSGCLRVEPAANQPRAIETHAARGAAAHIVLPAHRSGKTYTMAIHRHTAADLVSAQQDAGRAALQRFKAFPDNAVEYSCRTTTTISRGVHPSRTPTSRRTAHNDEIDRMRHSATARCSSAATWWWCLRLVHLRHRRAETTARCTCRSEGSRSTATRSCAGWWRAYERNDSTSTRDFRVRGDVVRSSPPTRSRARCASSCGATCGGDPSDRSAKARAGGLPEVRVYRRATT